MRADRLSPPGFQHRGGSRLLFAASLALLCLAIILTVVFFSICSNPRVKSVLLYPGGGSHPGWRYYDADGNTGWEVFDEYGYLSGIAGADKSALAAERIMTEDLPDAHLYFEYVDELISVYLDGELLYSDLPGTPAQGVTFLTPDADGFSAQPRTTLVSLPGDYTGRRLTVVTYLSPELSGVSHAFTAYPTLRSDQTIKSMPLAGSVGPLVVCGVLAAVTAAILVLLVYGAANGAAQWPSLLLALYFFSAMVKCAYNTEAAMNSIGTNLAAYLISAFPASFLLLFCACYMRKSFRITMLCAALADAASITALTVRNANAGLFYEANYSGWLSFALLSLFLLFCVLEWKAGKPFFKVICMDLLALFGVYLLFMLGAYTLFPGTDMGAQFYLPFSALFNGYPRGVHSLLSNGIAIAGAAAVFLRFLRDDAAQRSKSSILALKNEAMLHHIRSMESAVRQDKEQRHEMRHHIAALRILLKDGESEKAAAYLDRWSGTTEAIETKAYTGHTLVNAILSEAEARAHQDGIDFTAEINVSEPLTIHDNDLCSLVYNMLDNALYAAGQSPQEKRRVHIVMKTKDRFLAIRCGNSKTGSVITDEHGAIHTSRRDGSGHGYGLSVMQKVCEAYHSILLVEHTGDSFTVSTNLRMPD